MSNFQPPGTKIAWLERRLNAVESLLRKITNGATLVSSGTSGSTTGVLQDHDHLGTSSGGALTGTKHDSYDEHVAVSDPSSPAAGTARFYSKLSGGIAKLFYKQSDGTVVGPLGGAHGHVLQAVMDVTVGSTTVPYQVVGPMPNAGSIASLQAVLGENKTNGATSSIFDLHKILAASLNTDGQGTTIFTTQANRPTISTGNKLSTTTLPDVLTFAAGDCYAAYTDQAGTTATTATVSLVVNYT